MTIYVPEKTFLTQFSILHPVVAMICELTHPLLGSSEVPDAYRSATRPLLESMRKMELDLSSCHHRCHHRCHHLHDLVIVKGSNIIIYRIVKCRKKKHASRKDICIRDI